MRIEKFELLVLADAGRGSQFATYSGQPKSFLKQNYRSKADQNFTRWNQVSFGSGIRKNLNNQLRHAQELRGVVTTLDAIDQTQAIINGNQKILIAFRKWLANEGLSEKMQHEHHTNVRIFVNDRLSSAMPPRSLLSVKVADLDAYFCACDNKANRVSFKRLVKFLCDSNRIGWEENERMEKFLKPRWFHHMYRRA
jgi:hypothetical protein